jgi:PAS domain S-box-containing protein
VATSQGGGDDPPNLSAEALLGSLFEHCAMGIAVFSLDGHFLRANAAMCRMLGYSEQELLQETHQIRPEEDVAGLLKAFEDHSSNYRERVWRHRKKNGELIHVLLSDRERSGGA